MTDSGTEARRDDRDDHDDNAPTTSACANCGAPLNGEFCAQCGQSRKSIERSFLALAGEALGDILQWDGRFMTTYRSLFLRPGRVARDYADGKRQSYTPPVRLYLVISLIFFALLAWTGIRIVAVDISLDEAGDVSASVQLFQPPRDKVPAILPQETQDGLVELAEEQEVQQVFIELLIRAMNAPDAVEQQAAAASGQAMILMVVFFAVLSGVFHPRHRLIEHAIHALYFHAALLVPLALVMMIGIWMPWPDVRIPLGENGVPLALAGSIVLAILTIIGLLVAIVLFDRGFYRSSWVGALFRVVPIFVGYLLCAILVAVGLALFAALGARLFFEFLPTVFSGLLG